MVKNSCKYLHFWLETSGILLLHPLVSGYIFCSICHISETLFLRVYHRTQFSVPIFLDVSESDKSISWCLLGQQMWEQFFVFNFDCSTIYENPALFWKWLLCTFHWSLHSPGVVQRRYSFPFRFPLGYVWTYCKLFVTFNMGIMFTWIKTWW